MSIGDSIILPNSEATQQLGRAWAQDLVGGEVLALHGVIGAGKTQLVKGLALGLNYTGDVTSPTFTLVHEYLGGRLPIYHIDLYRLSDEQEASRMGLDDYLPSDGVTVIEWADRAHDLLPPHTRHWLIEVASLSERVVRRVL